MLWFSFISFLALFPGFYPLLAPQTVPIGLPAPEETTSWIYLDSEAWDRHPLAESGKLLLLQYGMETELTAFFPALRDAPRMQEASVTLFRLDGSSADCVFIDSDLSFDRFPAFMAEQGYTPEMNLSTIPLYMKPGAGWALLFPEGIVWSRTRTALEDLYYRHPEEGTLSAETVPEDLFFHYRSSHISSKLPGGANIRSFSLSLGGADTLDVRLILRFRSPEMAGAFAELLDREWESAGKVDSERSIILGMFAAFLGEVEILENRDCVSVEARISESQFPDFIDSMHFILKTGGLL